MITPAAEARQEVLKGMQLLDASPPQSSSASSLNCLRAPRAAHCSTPVHAACLRCCVGRCSARACSFAFALPPSAPSDCRPQQKLANRPPAPHSAFRRLQRLLRQQLTPACPPAPPRRQRAWCRRAPPLQPRWQSSAGWSAWSATCRHPARGRPRPRRCGMGGWEWARRAAACNPSLLSRAALPVCAAWPVDGSRVCCRLRRCQASLQRCWCPCLRTQPAARCTWCSTSAPASSRRTAVGGQAVGGCVVGWRACRVDAAAGDSCGMAPYMKTKAVGSFALSSATSSLGKQPAAWPCLSIINLRRRGVLPRRQARAWGCRRHQHSAAGGAGG